jgi:hypothetical protein
MRVTQALPIVLGGKGHRWVVVVVVAHVKNSPTRLEVAGSGDLLQVRPCGSGCRRLTQSPAHLERWLV